MEVKTLIYGQSPLRKVPLSEVALRSNKIEKYNVINLFNFDRVFFKKLVLFLKVKKGINIRLYTYIGLGIGKLLRVFRSYAT